jgi:hypothetical protein
VKSLVDPVVRRPRAAALCALACTTAVVFSLAPAPAEAGCNCGTISSYHSQTRREVARHISRVGADVNDHTTEVAVEVATVFQTEMRKSTQQVSARLDRQVYADERMRNAEQQNDAIQARQEIRADVENGDYDPAASACRTLSGVAAAAQGVDVSGSAPPANGHDFGNRSRNWARGMGPDGEQVRDGVQAIARAALKDRDRLQGLDGILDPTSDIRFLVSNPTVDTRDPDRVDALWRLRQNILDPAPPRPVTQSQANTPEGAVELARRQVDAARRSVASDVFGFIESLHAPINDDLGDWARRTVPEGYSYPVPDAISKQQFVDLQVASRFANSSWHDQVGRMSPEATRREKLIIEAMRAEIDWLRLRLAMRRGLAKAARLSEALEGGEREVSR